MFDVSPDSVDTGTSVSRDLNSEWHVEADTSMSSAPLFLSLRLRRFRLSSIVDESVKRINLARSA